MFTRIRASKTKFLLDSRFDQAKGLCVEEINQVAKAAQKEDIPLVLAHAMRIEFTIYKRSFLLVECKTFQFRVIENRMAGRGPFTREVVIEVYLFEFLPVGHRLTDERPEFVRMLRRSGGRARRRVGGRRIVGEAIV